VEFELIVALAAIYLWLWWLKRWLGTWPAKVSVSVAVYPFRFCSFGRAVSCNQPTSSDHKSQMAAATIIDRLGKHRNTETQKKTHSRRSPKASFVANLGMISLPFECEFVAPAAMPLNCVRIAIGSGKWEILVHRKNSDSGSVSIEI